METFEPGPRPQRDYRMPFWETSRWNGFEPRPGDIYVCTPYKSGTTWMQMICALLVFGTPDLPKPLAEISPWMELRAAPADEIHALFAAQDHRRIIKSHAPLDALPWHRDATYLVVHRDPRDVVMSLMNHMANVNPESDTIFARERRASGEAPREVPKDPDAFFRGWLSEGSVPWESDGAPLWSLFRHGATFWTHRAKGNIHFFHYDDLKSDRAGGMRRVADILGIEVAEDRWPALVEAASFGSMKKNADRTAPDTNLRKWADNGRFFNKGTSRQWEGVLSAGSLELMYEVAGRYPADFIDWLYRGRG